MIVRLANTSSQDVDSRLLALREEGGVVALGRVLTLIILTDNGDAETAIAAANEASREHPRSEEHTSELQSRGHLVCRLLLEKKNTRHTKKRTRHDAVR